MTEATYTYGATINSKGVDPVALDPSNHFEAVLADIVTTFRKKNQDYADGQRWSSNFEDVAHQMGFDHPVVAADALIATKQARLRSLMVRGTEPANESVLDTYLDRAVYAVIAYALLRDEELSLGKE